MIRHLLHPLQRLDSVQFRHHMIQENQIILFLTYIFQTRHTTLGCVNLYAGLFQKPLHHLEIHLDIIDNQNLRILCDKRPVLLVRCMKQLLTTLVEISDRICAHHLLRYFRRKARAFSINTFRVDFAVHHLNKISGEI